jgi:hypothetical protein
MPKAEEFRIGAVVRCASGEACGVVRYLDIDPHTRKLTHLVVEEKGRQGLGRLVPTGQVHSDRQTHEIQFVHSMAKFRELDPSDATGGYEHVSEGDVEIPSGDIRRGHDFHVHAGSHEFGRIHGVLVDADACVTHVLLGEWHGLRHVEVAVPFADRDTVQDDGFHFSMTKQQMEALPPLGTDYPGV